MAKLADLFVKLGLNNSSFNKGLKDSEKKTSLFGKGVKKIGGLIAGAFAVTAIVSFGKELLMLGGVAEGVRKAFNRIADDKVLEDLKAATKGTVSELELMKRAVMASNFKLPVKQLAGLFEFATKRAQETGESVDFLVNSIVLGIGRKSPLILDNLGISAVELRQKLEGVGHAGATVGDVAKAVGEIAKEAMQESGEIIDTNVIKVANLAAEWDNFKLSIAESEGFNNAVARQLDELQQEFEFFFNENITKWTKWKTFVGGLFSTDFYKRQLEEAAAKSRQLWDEESTAFRNSIAGGDEVIENKEAQAKTIGELKAETEELTKSLDLYNVNQDAEIQSTLRQIDANKKLIKSLTELRRTQDAAVPGKVKGIGTPESIGIGIDPEEGLANMQSFYDRMDEQLGTFSADYLADWDEFTAALGELIIGGVVSLVDEFGNAMGELLATGKFPSDFGNDILNVIGNFLSGFGKMLIALGVGSQAFQALLGSAFTNPVSAGLAIAAGASLVLLGGAISGYASKGPSGAGSVSSGGSSATGYSTQGRSRASQDTVIFELRGDKLIGVINNTNRKNSIIG